MRYALVNDTTHLVENIVVIDANDGSQPPAGYSHIQSNTANIGDSWDGSQFTPGVP